MIIVVVVVVAAGFVVVVVVVVRAMVVVGMRVRVNVVVDSHSAVRNRVMPLLVIISVLFKPNERKRAIAINFVSAFLPPSYRILSPSSMNLTCACS